MYGTHRLTDYQGGLVGLNPLGNLIRRDLGVEIVSLADNVEPARFTILGEMLVGEYLL